MASQKLTAALRRHIVDAAIEHAFGARRSELFKEKQAIGDAVYADTYTPHLETMKKLPEDFFDKDDSIYVSFAGKRNYLPMSEIRLVCANCGGRRESYAADHELSQRFDDYAAKSQALKRERRQAYAKISAAVNAVNTTKQLLDAWPEAKQFMPDDAAPVQALAIPREELNALVGLSS